MPRINIHEHSETYSIQTQAKAFGCVAFPITAIWGPAYDPSDEDANPDWVRFSAGYRGTTDFMETFRGANNTMGARDKSFDYALKLLSAGYDILVKRADGLGKRSTQNLFFDAGEGSTKASGTATFNTVGKGVEVITVEATAANAGEFGNKLKFSIQKVSQSLEFSKQYSGKVTALISIYMTTDGNNSTNVTSSDILIDQIRFSYTQKPATINGAGEETKWATETVNLDSAYINKLVIKGLGSLPDNMLLQANLTSGKDGTDAGKLIIKAKYPGSFGNQLKVRVKTSFDDYGRKIGTVEVFNRNGYTGNDNKIIHTDQLLERVPVAFEFEAATDARPYVTEASYNYLSTVLIENADKMTAGKTVIVSLLGGTDYATNVGEGEGTIPSEPAIDVQIMNLAKERFESESSTFLDYLRDRVGDSTKTTAVKGSATESQIVQLWNQQRTFQNAIEVIKELTDPVVYDWDAVFMGIGDDQYIPQSWKDEHPEIEVEYDVTTAHLTLFQVAADSKCGMAMVGTPFGMKRGTYLEESGYTSGAVKFKDDLSSYVGKTLSTFGECVGPWCKATLPLNGDNAWVTPEVGHLLLMINSEGVGGMLKWWMPPAGMLGTGICHSPEYKVKKAYLDIIQNHEQGVCLNPLMDVPGKGFTCFGNSTLWNKPLGTYNALQNLSTRLLCNRVKQRIWDTALTILFKYNNQDAYSHFYAGVSPLLDEMLNVGALTPNAKNPKGYRIVMNPDIINLDRLNANTVIGKVELAVTGVIDTVDVDLFLLPPNAFDLE